MKYGVGWDQVVQILVQEIVRVLVQEVVQEVVHEVVQEVTQEVVQNTWKKKARMEVFSLQHSECRYGPFMYRVRIVASSRSAEVVDLNFRMECFYHPQGVTQKKDVCSLCKECSEPSSDRPLQRGGA